MKPETPRTDAKKRDLIRLRGSSATLFSFGIMAAFFLGIFFSFKTGRQEAQEKKIPISCFCCEGFRVSIKSLYRPTPDFGWASHFAKSRYHHHAFIDSVYQLVCFLQAYALVCIYFLRSNFSAFPCWYKDYYIRTVIKVLINRRMWKRWKSLLHRFSTLRFLDGLVLQKWT